MLMPLLCLKEASWFMEDLYGEIIPSRFITKVTFFITASSSELYASLGQGFFVRTKTDNTKVSFNAAMQSHKPGKLAAYTVLNVEIRVVGDVGEGAVATLFNGLGKVVVTKKLESGNLNIIGLPNLSSGVYLLNINDKGTAQTIKVMVRK